LALGKRLSYERIYKIIKELAASAGLEGVHPHRGRHTFISNLVEDGVDAYLAMELSRQRSVNTFKIYSKKARYVKAKSRFFETKGEKERKAMSLEEMLAKG
jgi:integrase/recombinase XerD